MSTTGAYPTDKSPYGILDLAGNPEQRRKMGASGRQYIVSKFSREKTARDYITVLKELGSP